MSSASPTVEASSAPPTPGTAPAPRAQGAAVTWAIIGCILLGTSGAVRAIQDHRHSTEKAYKEDCPIDLGKIPGRVGEWKLIEGGEKHLDEMTMRITGGSDHVIRTYANELTGVRLTVLILFGPAAPVMPHTPQVCYPAGGFVEGDVPTVRAIPYKAGTDDKGRPIEGRADFLSASYSKPNGRQALREAVYHSFRLDGTWSPLIANRKFPRRNPGIFKIQIQRMVADGEKVGPGDPIEQFLESFLGELESEIRSAPQAPKVAAR